MMLLWVYLHEKALTEPSVSIMSKARDTKVSHSRRIRLNASANLEIVPL